MAHLRDLEELVSSIRNTEMKNYMREAMSCYMAGAYRACIVLTFIAMFEDISKKLEELGKINKKARSISQEIEKRKNEQDIFESYLLDQLKANNLIPAIDHDFYQIIKTLRNKSAHPSGHRCSAEEARFVIYESITRFMCHPNFSTTQACDEILSRIGDSNFFPSNLISATTETVKKEISNVHETAVPYLLEKIIDKYLTSESSTLRNCEFFINGLARIDREDICTEIKLRLIEKKITNKNYHNIIFSSICANAKLLKNIHNVTLSRIKPLLSEAISNKNPSSSETLFDHPASFFRSIVEQDMALFITENLLSEFQSFIEKFPYSKLILKVGLPQENLYDLLAKNLLNLAGSNHFDTANSFIEHVNELDEITNNLLLPKDCFELIVQINSAAETGAWRSIRVRDSNFSRIPNIKASALSFISSSSEDAQQICQRVSGRGAPLLSDLSARLMA
ncbi:hypothetical protein J4P02_22580 [Pseudomonas sp. NFXW11]|uniref:hypothetical protein n=1 Tax=Pseudomonas sp. NFXW11 TaxID=2819531 RepID=UPI003CF31554